MYNGKHVLRLTTYIPLIRTSFHSNMTTRQCRCGHWTYNLSFVPPRCSIGPITLPVNGVGLPSSPGGVLWWPATIVSPGHLGYGWSSQNRKLPLCWPVGRQATITRPPGHDGPYGDTAPRHTPLKRPPVTTVTTAVGLIAGDRTLAVDGEGRVDEGVVRLRQVGRYPPRSARVHYWRCLGSFIPASNHWKHWKALELRDRVVGSGSAQQAMLSEGSDPAISPKQTFELNLYKKVCSMKGDQIGLWCT